MDFEYLGPYKIDGLLGKGGMGSVYKGHHSKTGEVVAVKVIAESIANHERFRRRFDSEIETLRRLSNRYIVKLLGYGEEKGRLFYSMEYVEGESLHDRIRRDGRLTWDVTLRYAIDVCTALKHAHDIGVIHRDIKPSNLIVTTADTIKMTDFGIAKLYGNSEETALGSVLGTADFMPPEQAEGGRVTVRSDLYSLGAVMYMCLSGRSPHHAKSTPEVLYNVRYKIPERLSEKFDGIPREMEILILELLEKNAELRPKTALLVWNRLAAMQAGLNKLQLPDAPNKLDSPSQRTNIDPSMSFDLKDVDPELASEVRQRSFSSSATEAHNENTARVNLDQVPKKPGLDITLASEAVLAASHMGRTTPVATHLTELSGDGEQGSSVGTRFTTVDEEATKRPSTAFHSEESTNQWSNILSIALLSAAILACIAGIYLATRKPAADNLYKAVVVAVESSQSMDVIAEELNEFRRHYPADPRLAEFADFDREITMQRRINSLTRRARRDGDTALTPVEVSFLEAMQLRDQNDGVAIQRLQDLLTVFQDRSVLSPDDRELVDYAGQELRRLMSQTTSLEKRDTQLLREQLDAAETMEPAKRAEFYRSILRLYEHKLFAKDLIEEARRKLKELEVPAVDSNSTEP